MHNANAFINLPSLDTWENLQPLERERREGILRNISIRMSEYGPHRAIASPNEDVSSCRLPPLLVMKA